MRPSLIQRRLRHIRRERRHHRRRVRRRAVLTLNAFVPGGRLLVRQTRCVEEYPAEQWKTRVSAWRQEGQLLDRIRRVRIQKGAGSVSGREGILVVRVRDRPFQVRDLYPRRVFSPGMWWMGLSLNLSGCSVQS